MNLEPSKRRVFGERLKQAATAHYGREYGCSSWIARDMGVSIQTASKWLRGDATPEAWRWGELATLLNVSTQWLTGATHDTPEHIKRRFGDENLALATTSARLVFPLILRLKPDADQKLIDELMTLAYQELKAGSQQKTVSGEVAQRLIA